MKIYHIYIKTLSRKQLFGYDATKQTLNKLLKLYFNDMPFNFLGNELRRSEILNFELFESTEPVKKMKLPNGKCPMDEDNYEYVAKVFREGRVEGVISGSSLLWNAYEKKRTAIAPVETFGKNTVFIVHGRDDKQALVLQKHLRDDLHVDAKMFEDFKEQSKSRTIIEQLEYIRKNAGYAFIVVMPDDLGILREDFENSQKKLFIGKKRIEVKEVCSMLEALKTRARQNVVFEFGLFMGALGRNNVCCLLQDGTQERPSDIEGIIYTDFNKSVKEKSTEIEGKLKDAKILKT